ncbi:DEAD/DEAH box helicase [Porticoccus sp. W117]|uniref:DEAD/DEAH box helicase n=1 Tax=Porticoccus sp. W117 TaxID=3054777 RepID=UPI00259ADAD4|nr:DEAD/DEAH box helicase [Porticoccus sp. W117]MDM3869793.1 DEAD/DEAH box helicase [Porticoccus sp. W117]
MSDNKGKAQPQFEDFGLHGRLLETVGKEGFSEPTAVQAQVIPAALQGQDLLVTAETGSGKSAAFLLPMLQRFLQADAPKSGTRALVLAPTRELARQVLAHCIKLKKMTHLKADVITGGQEFRFQKAMLRKNPEIIVATPGRILEHLEKGSADFSDLEVLVLDEADRMLDMGFSEDVLTIAKACNLQRQTLLLSATLKHRGIRKVADAVLNNPQTIAVNSVRSRHSSIQQQIVLADDVEHKQKLLLKLLQQESAQKTVVFTNTIAGAEKLVGWLYNSELRAGILHGDLLQDERNHVMQQMRRGQLDVLVATDVAARGLDVQGVGLVINFDMARSGDDYVHRIGRTGRAGEQGTAISFITSTEWNLMASIERYLKTRFERLVVAGLEGKYKGPKKLKASGKAAGTKKKKLAKKTAKNATPKKAANKRRPGKKPIHDSGKEEGFAPLRRKK